MYAKMESASLLMLQITKGPWCVWPYLCSIREQLRLLSDLVEGAERTSHAQHCRDLRKSSVPDAVTEVEPLWLWLALIAGLCMLSSLVEECETSSFALLNLDD